MINEISSPPQAINIAGFWRRVAAALIDWVFIFLVFFLAGFVMLGANHLGIIGKLFATMLWSVWIVFLLCYAWIAEAKYGQTVGKWLMRLMVIKEKDPSKIGIGYGRSLVRRLVRLLSSFLFLLGHLWSLLNKKRKTWHDFASGVVVVQKS